MMETMDQEHSSADCLFLLFLEPIVEYRTKKVFAYSVERPQVRMLTILVILHDEKALQFVLRHFYLHTVASAKGIHTWMKWLTGYSASKTDGHASCISFRTKSVHSLNFSLNNYFIFVANLEHEQCDYQNISFVLDRMHIVAHCPSWNLRRNINQFQRLKYKVVQERQEVWRSYPNLNKWQQKTNMQIIYIPR